VADGVVVGTALIEAATRSTDALTELVRALAAGTVRPAEADQ
jgi:tryptophan synthase alpha subunit